MPKLFKVQIITLAIVTTALLTILLPKPALAADPVVAYLSAPVSFPIPGGHFFKQANGLGGGGDSGFAVIDDSDAKFWSEFRRLGGIDAVGYPISRKMKWGGYTVQVFQRGVLQWRPEAQQAWFVNVFDMMHDLGYDTWLVSSKATPKPLDPSFDAGKEWAAIVRDRQSLLNANPAIMGRYWQSADPMTFFGLPTSRVADNGTHYVIRLQRAVIQQWKVDVPWAKAGQVTVANGGDIGAQAGLFPSTGYDVQSPFSGRNGKTVVLDPGHGGAEVGSARDEPRLVEKELNLNIMRQTAAYLASSGFNVVMTRNTDVRVNNPGRELTGDKDVDMKDDLQARIDIANNAKADVLVSLHFNGYTGANLQGTTVHYTLGRPFSNQSLKLSQSLLSAILRNLRSAGYPGATDRGVQDDSRLFGTTGHLYLFSNESARPSTMPGALTEALFLTSAEDAAQLAQAKIQQAIALGHAQGIASYFGLTVSQDLSPTTSAPVPVTTPPPSTSATPVVTASGQRMGVVQSLGKGGIVRTEPTTASASVLVVPDNTQVILMQVVKGQLVDGQEARWYKVVADGKTGYLYSSLIVPADPRLALPPATGTIRNPDGFANARSGPRADQPLIKTLDAGAQVDVLDVVVGQNVNGTEDRWYQVLVDDTVAYIYAPLIAF
jgi:N-acetylmuramoyl-L-alanine amidase